MALALAGLTAMGAPNGQVLDQLLSVHRVDLVVLDIGLPGENGLSIARRLSTDAHSIGIIVLSARGVLGDRLDGLHVGADAYLVKPVDPRELIATIEAVRRRLNDRAASAQVVRLSRSVSVDLAPTSAEFGWSLNHASGQLRMNRPPNGVVGSRTVTMSTNLSELQFQFLSCFKAAISGQVVARSTLMRALGHDTDLDDPHRLETLVSRLRVKVRNTFNKELPLRAVAKSGYALTESISFD